MCGANSGETSTEAGGRCKEEIVKGLPKEFGFILKRGELLMHFKQGSESVYKIVGKFLGINWRIDGREL